MTGDNKVADKLQKCPPKLTRKHLQPKPEADPKPDPSLINTPAPRVSRVSKSVVVIRQPIPGAQVTQTDKVGIGISFGMTAKGDVFITGMAPNGPAKASGIPPFVSVCERLRVIVVLGRCAQSMHTNNTFGGLVFGVEI
jgi:hypothetical protein